MRSTRCLCRTLLPKLSGAASVRFMLVESVILTVRANWSKIYGCSDTIMKLKARRATCSASGSSNVALFIVLDGFDRHAKIGDEFFVFAVARFFVWLAQ